MNAIWRDPFLKVDKLSSIFAEVSSDNSTLFGYLTPANIATTLQDLMTAKNVTTISSINVYVQPVVEGYGALDTAQTDLTTMIGVYTKAMNVDCQFLFQTQGDYICIQ
jgi:hypothetical protein